MFLTEVVIRRSKRKKSYAPEVVHIVIVSNTLSFSTQLSLVERMAVMCPSLNSLPRQPTDLSSFVDIRILEPRKIGFL